jgi:hypothetical protein
MICPPCSQLADAGVIPHEDCAAKCDCQHGRPYEMSANEHGFAGYLDSLPDGAPERVEYERRTGRTLPPRAGTPAALEST